MWTGTTKGHTIRTIPKVSTAPIVDMILRCLDMALMVSIYRQVVNGFLLMVLCKGEFRVHSEFFIGACGELEGMKFGSGRTLL